MITNPESATKERLKAELKRAGVGFDAHENKDYYVQLYRAHVMRPKGGGAAKGKARRSEFSSDEETVIKTRGSPRKQEVRHEANGRQMEGRVPCPCQCTLHFSIPCAWRCSVRPDTPSLPRRRPISPA